ncbi:MAG: hypothetical protein IJC99_02255 [Clostridia bacterium]|nr:hypothetical protein [Clostridia bacterium]
MATRRRKETGRLTAAAVLVALSVVLLAVGSLVEVLDLSMAAIASLAVVFAVIELRGKYPYLVFVATAALAILLLPNKTPALVYALFAGYYPLLKVVFEKHFSRPVAWAFKLLSFFVSAVLIAFIAIKLFTVAPLQVLPYPWLYGLAGLLLVAVFVIYDIALTRLITFYLWRLQRHFRFLHKD